MTKFVLLIYQTCLQPCHHTTNTFCARRACTRRAILSTRALALLGRTADHAWRTARRNSGAVEGIHVSDPDPQLVPNIRNWGSCLDSELAMAPRHILLCQKSSRLTCCVGRGIVLDIHKLSSKKKRPSPMEAYTITEKRDVGSATESSIQHHQFTPPTIVDGTPYHHWGWGATVIVRGWDARINLSVPPLVLLCEGARPSLWNSITRDWSLKWPRSHLLHGGVAFDSLQSQSGTPGGTPRPIDRNQKPTMPWTDKRLRNRRIIITRRQEAEMKRSSLTIQTNCLCAFSGCGQTPSTSTPALMRPNTVSVASQNFADTSLRHTQYCCHF